MPAGKDEQAWLNLHENIKWTNGYLFIFSKCKLLTLANTCAEYKTRPDICRNFVAESAACVSARIYAQNIKPLKFK